MKKLTNRLFKTQTGRFIAGAAALLLAVVLTMGAGSMEFLRADVTAQQVMTIDPAAAQIVRGVNEEVALYYLSTDDSKDAWLDELLKKYDAMNESVHYVMINPASNSASEIAAMAGSALSENMLVVVSEDRLFIVQSDEFYEIRYSLREYYTSGMLVEESRIFVADEQIANAILCVTRDDMPVVYTLSGHGEVSPGIAVRDELWKNNIDVQPLVLDGAVPEDAAMVMIYAPMMDISQAEADALLEYVRSGGKLVVATNYMLLSAPNLNSVMAYYGMQSQYGIVVDMTEGRRYAAEVPYYLTPEMMQHPITQPLLSAATTMLMPMSGALERNEVVRDTLTVTELMRTSENAHLKNPILMTTLEKENGDAAGRFALAMAAEEGESCVVWFAGTEFMTDENVEYSSQLNLYLMDGIRAWMLPETDERISIEDGNLLAAATNVPAQYRAVVCIVLFVPALIALIAGIVLLPKKRVRAAEE